MSIPSIDLTERRLGPRPPFGPLPAYVLTLWVSVSLNFLLPRAMPGNPVLAQLARASPTYVYNAAARAHLQAYYHLNHSLGYQYLHYLAALIRGDLGRSVATQTPVIQLLGRHLPWTLLLMGTATLVATVAGFAAGVHSGWRRGGRCDRGLLTAFLGMQNVPVYVLGSVILFVFAFKLRWFPLSGGETPFQSFSLLGHMVNIAWHLVLPATVLALQITAFQFLLTRAGVVAELGADYLVLGRAKGLRDRKLQYGYAGRNALLPLVSNTALQLGAAVTGTIFVERVFAYPGMGTVLFDAIANRDYPVLQGCFLTLSVLVVTLNLGSDLLYRRLDPRTGR